MQDTYRYCKDVTSRKKLSFRSDFYPSIQVIAQNWDSIISEMKKASANGHWMNFAEYLNSIEGLGAGRKKMKIKIPLILRELRTQNIFNIPGEYCCVTDERVKKAAKELNISLPTITDIQSVMNSSKIIYGYFGDLFDIALFAYEDYRDLM